MNKIYRERAKRLATYNDEPSMTDQTGSEDTDINIIVKRYGVYGTVPQGKKQPQFGVDTSEWPTDLALAIDLSRSLDDARAKLPPQLRELKTDELLALTPEKLVAILTPPVQTGDNKEITQ